MKKQVLCIWGYGALLLVGGLIGFVKAGSIASLIMGSACASIVVLLGYLVQKNKPRAYCTTLATIGLLFAFFLYRFSLSYKVVPSGVMAIVSLFVGLYLYFTRPKDMA